MGVPCDFRYILCNSLSPLDFEIIQKTIAMRETTIESKIDWLAFKPGF